MSCKFWIICCLFCIAVSMQGQVISGTNARLFSCTDASGDSIYFLKVDTAINIKKPVIIFCQGSLPYPLIIDWGNRRLITNISNFDYNKLSRRYHIVMISMPHTPPVVSQKQLNQQFAFVTDTANQCSFDSLYIKNNYLDKYVERGESVLAFLRKQSWVDVSNISVFGHSQGSYIALALGIKHPELKAVGYSGGNPEGRFTLFIRNTRRAALKGEMSEEEAQKKIDDFYVIWKAMQQGRLINGFETGDPAHSWTSFTVSQREDLIRLKVPLFLTYGTKDLESAEGCELMPIYFEKAGKTNYKMYPVVGCGHNFEEYKPNGSPNYDKMHWDDVMLEFVKWMECL